MPSKDAKMYQEILSIRLRLLPRPKYFDEAKRGHPYHCKN